jgi:hypothetical protein
MGGMHGPPHFFCTMEELESYLDVGKYFAVVIDGRGFVVGFTRRYSTATRQVQWFPRCGPDIALARLWELRDATRFATWFSGDVIDVRLVAEDELA